MEATAKKKKGLNPVCIVAFLQQAVKCIEFQNGKTAKFFKFVIIAKKCLYVSRRYPVYHLTLTKNLESFVRLLNPKSLCVMFDGMGDQMTEKCREVMRSCTGKLSIQKFDGYYDKRFLSGLEEFADRIQNLTCKLNFFNAEIVPKLTLEKYEGVSYRPTMDQAEFLLRSLKVTQFSSTFWYIQRNDLTLAGLTLNERDCNYIIKHLTLTFLHCSMDVLEGFCSRLLTICPKLKSINLKAHFYSDEDPFSSDGVVEKGVALRTLYNKLKGNFVGLNYFSLEFKHEIECEKQEYDDSWIADLKRRDGFRQAKFQYEDHYRAYNKLIVEQHEDKFDGAFCVEVIYHE